MPNIHHHTTWDSVLSNFFTQLAVDLLERLFAGDGDGWESSLQVKWQHSSEKGRPKSPDELEGVMTTVTRKQIRHIIDALSFCVAIILRALLYYYYYYLLGRDNSNNKGAANYEGVGHWRWLPRWQMVWGWNSTKNTVASWNSACRCSGSRELDDVYW